MSRSPTDSLYNPIGSYGLIGNRRSAALVGMDGSIDWCCFPRFDSPSVFAAILDAKKGGRFSITPEGTYTPTQRYVGMTNVLETKFETRDGTCILIDCMPLYEGDDGVTVQLHQIVRLVRCERGTITLRLDCTPRPDYARAAVDTAVGNGKVTWKSQAGNFSLGTSADVEVTSGGVEGTLVMREGQEAVFVLGKIDKGNGCDALLSEPEAVALATKTVEYWRRWVGQCTYRGRWREMVQRSALALKLLTFKPYV